MTPLKPLCGLRRTLLLTNGEERRSDLSGTGNRIKSKQNSLKSLKSKVILTNETSNLH